MQFSSLPEIHYRTLWHREVLRAPLDMELKMSATPWADEPYPLVPAPKEMAGTSIASSEALFMASEMAHAHNAIIRTLNSMYLQAPYVKEPSDINDLLTYAIFWLDWVYQHHTIEEEYFFPAIARISGRQDIMEVNVKQHHDFEECMETFRRYVVTCMEGVRFEADSFRECINGFGTELCRHLGDEIVTLIALDAYDIKAIRKEYDVFEAKLRAGSFVSSSILRRTIGIVY